MLTYPDGVTATAGPARPRVCVYCASRTGADPAFAEAATAVGGELGRRGADLVFGGGHVGLMGLLADAALAGGSHVVGVITEQLLDKEVAHRGVTDLRVVADMPARKAEMYAAADAFLTLPGGIGTMEEFFEVLTWGYLGLHPKPMALLDVSGYYQPLLVFLQHAIGQGLLRPGVLDLLVVGEDPGDVLDRLLAAAATDERLAG